MDKKDLVNLLNELFKPLGFKRRGNNWRWEGIELTKNINLQKSQSGNFFYMHYNYYFNVIGDKRVPHVFSGLGSLNSDENKRIKELLDLENDIESDKRLTELRTSIEIKIIAKIQNVNTEAELLDHIKTSPIFLVIPLVVKEHFKLK